MWWVAFCMYVCACVCACLCTHVCMDGKSLLVVSGYIRAWGVVLCDVCVLGGMFEVGMTFVFVCVHAHMCTVYLWN